jgi:hypothetical protein
MQQKNYSKQYKVKTTALPMQQKKYSKQSEVRTKQHYHAATKLF